MIRKISHIGVAVKDLEMARDVFEVLGLRVEGEEVVEGQKVRVAFISVGDVRIELLEATAPDSPVARFIEKRGEGLHHIALEVDDLEGTLEELKAKGLNLIDEKPRKGAHNAMIAFIHPTSAGGLLLELCQEE